MPSKPVFSGELNADRRTALTPTEGRIVRLVVAGRSNPEVAAELRISRQTVEWHLWRTYRGGPLPKPRSAGIYDFQPRRGRER